MRLGIAITRAANVKPGWTTAHIAEAALARGHTVRFIEPWDFELDMTGRLVARSTALDPGRWSTREEICEALAGRLAPRRYVEIAGLDALLIRINPMDMAVMSFALEAQRHGVVVLNPPGVLPLTSHKAYPPSLQGVPRPATMVSRSRGALEIFAESYEHGVVVKPARASGGRGIEWIKPGDGAGLRRALEAAGSIGDGYIVVQEYLLAAEDGEKRLLWLDGVLLGGYLRRRAPGEFRHNLKLGSLPEPCEPDAEDRKLVEAISPELHKDGIWFAGIDVIGGRIVEINTLNPGGLHLTQVFGEQDLATPVLESLERRVAAGS